MSRIKFIIKNTSWFLGANITGSTLSVVLLPLYTSYLSPIDYGIVAICLMVSNIISCFSTFGLEYFSVRIYYRFRDKKEKLSLLLGNIYLVSLILIVSTLIILSVFPGLIHHYFFNNSAIPSAIIIFVPIWHAFFARITAFLHKYLTFTQKGREFFFVFSSQSLLVHILKITLLVLFDAGVVGFLMAELATQLIFAAISVLLLRHYVRPKFNLRKIRTLKMGVLYGIPMIPQNLGTWIVQYADRIIILRYMDMWNVGIYSFALSLSSRIFNFFWGAINRGIFPEIVTRMDNKKDYKKSEEHAIEYFYSFLLFTSFLGLIFSLFARDIIYILANERFHQAHTIIPLFVLMLIFQNGKSIISFPINLKFKTWFHPLNTFLGAAINITLNLILIPVFGIFGAALASLISYFLIFIFTLIFAQRQIYIRYNYFIAALPVIVSIIVFLTKLYFQLSALWSICANLLIVMLVIFLSAIYLMNYCPTLWRVISVVYYKLLQKANFIYNRKDILTNKTDG